MSHSLTCPKHLAGLAKPGLGERLLLPETNRPSPLTVPSPSPPPVGPPALTRMPSNFAATKVSPGSLMASANSWRSTWMPPQDNASWEMYPDRLPVPYWISKVVPFFCGLGVDGRVWGVGGGGRVGGAGCIQEREKRDDRNGGDAGM